MANSRESITLKTWNDQFLFLWNDFFITYSPWLQSGICATGIKIMILTNYVKRNFYWWYSCAFISMFSSRKLLITTVSQERIILFLRQESIIIQSINFSSFQMWVYTCTRIGDRESNLVGVCLLVLASKWKFERNTRFTYQMPPSKTLTRSICLKMF